MLGSGADALWCPIDVRGSKLVRERIDRPRKGIIMTTYFLLLMLGTSYLVAWKLAG